MLHLETLKRNADGSWTVQTHDGGLYGLGETYLDERLGWSTVTAKSGRPLFVGASREIWRVEYTLTMRPAAADEIAAAQAAERAAERRDQEWRAGAPARFWQASFGDTLPGARNA